MTGVFVICRQTPGRIRIELAGDTGRIQETKGTVNTYYITFAASHPAHEYYLEVCACSEEIAMREVTSLVGKWSGLYYKIPDPDLFCKGRLGNVLIFNHNV